MIENHFKWMKPRFSIRSNLRKIVLEKGSFKILHLESASKSCTFFTHTKSLFHHQRYFTNNSPDTKTFFMITSFYYLAEPATIFIIFGDFLMVYQIFLSPQVKWSMIIINKHSIYKLPQMLPNDLRKIRKISKLARIKN